ncbi:MAG: citrate synthase [Coriobacteriales bacterium]|jgi:citrate synthase|nr:citrate synthase [Coriobacteriales bacterium]
MTNANNNSADVPRIALYDEIESINRIDPAFYEKYDVKRGLRNADGTGVIAGITNISEVYGYKMVAGQKEPAAGRLIYRGYDVNDLIDGACAEGSDSHYIFEEIIYLLLMGELPTPAQLDGFVAALDAQRELPDGFTASYIMQPASPDIMNALARSVLMLYASDAKAEDRSYEHEISTAISLLSRLPRIMVLAYYAKRAAFEHESMLMHRFIPGQSSAETVLSMLRPDRCYTPEEARMLAVMLCLHAEHGGGNNSTFTTRVLTSSDTDPYSAYAGALGSLKGRKHGGANHQVRRQQAAIKEAVADWDDDEELSAYLSKIVRREIPGSSGLIYGMGHAVYTKSDPRAVICKRFAEKLAAGSTHEAELRLLENIERLSPAVLAEVKGPGKTICANVDMYSGFVYTMLGIPEDLFTPLFACSRMAGWAAHRFEEIVSGRRIIRPAYKTTNSSRHYLPLAERS